MATAGRILILPKGTYNEATAYDMLDLVSYNGSSWLAKKSSVGIVPSEANSEYWQNMINLDIADNLETKVKGKVLDASQGKILDDKIKEVLAELKTKSESLAYDSYEDMVYAINAMNAEDMKKGQNIHIAAIGVPDIWVCSVEETNVPYSYVSEDAIAEEFSTNDAVRIGYYQVAQIEAKGNGGSAVNPNILVNSNFANPVNQRGEANYYNESNSNGSSYMHTIDRWRISSGEAHSELIINDDNCVTFKGGRGTWFGQDIEHHEKFANKTITASVKVSNIVDRVVLSMFDGKEAASVELTENGIFKTTLTVSNVPEFLRVYVQAGGSTFETYSSVDIEWIKLEYGKYATEYVAPLYSDELLRCGVIDNSSLYGYSPIVDNLIPSSGLSDLQEQVSELNEKIEELREEINAKPTPVTTQTGSGSLGSITVGTYLDYVVTFTTPFDTIPSVLITSSVTYITLEVLEVTRGGFTFRQTATAALSGKYNWTATG